MNEHCFLGYATFRWPPENLKLGFYSVCVCMPACTHILSFACMHVRTHKHTHTQMHTQNLLGIHVGYNVKYEGGKKQA